MQKSYFVDDTFSSGDDYDSRNDRDTTMFHMEVDIGSSCSCYVTDYVKIKDRIKDLRPSKVKPKSYSGHSVKLLCECTVKVRVASKPMELPLLIASKRSTSLLGRD